MTRLADPFPNVHEPMKVLIAGQSCGCVVQIAMLRMPTFMWEAMEAGQQVTGVPIVCSQCEGRGTATISSAEPRVMDRP